MDRPTPPNDMPTTVPVACGSGEYYRVERAKPCTTAIIVVRGNHDGRWRHHADRFVAYMSGMFALRAVVEGDLGRLPEALAQAQSRNVVLLPWVFEADGLLDRVKHLLEPVTERAVQLGPAPLLDGLPTFVNARAYLERWVHVYPGWHRTATLFESFTHDGERSRRIAVLWSGLSVDVKQQWTDTMSEACLLLAAALNPEVQATAHQQRDGKLYLDFLCSIVRACCRQLE